MPTHRALPNRGKSSHARRQTKKEVIAALQEEVCDQKVMLVYLAVRAERLEADVEKLQAQISVRDKLTERYRGGKGDGATHEEF